MASGPPGQKVEVAGKRAAAGQEESTTLVRRLIVNKGHAQTQSPSDGALGTHTLPLSVSYQIRELLLDDGDSPFAEWFVSLEAVAAAKVRVAVSRMEQGNLSNVEWFRGIGEYKIDWGPGLRIYLAKDGLQIIILIGGGTKKRQQQGIDQAVALWEDYKRRKASTSKGGK
jgi:putative addiction module killer protein